MKKYIWLIIILITFLLTLGLFVYFTRSKSNMPISSNTNSVVNTVSSPNSYIFASPIRAKSSGDLIRVTVFILDDNGYGIKDRTVSLSIDSNVSITEIQPLTDTVGRAMFDLSSSVNGSFQIEASVDNLTLDQKIRVIFDGGAGFN